MENLVIPSRSFWANKRVLVTGHTGFKGAWLCLWLRSMGANVYGFSLPASEQSLYVLGGLEQAVPGTLGDIRELATVNKAVEDFKPEIILHLAAQSLVRLSYSQPVETYATNVMGTVHLLAAAQAVESVRAMVVVTSDKCYENREWDWPYRENEPMGGHDPYSSSKGCAELVTSAWRKSFCDKPGRRPLGIASARAGNVIGGGDWAEDRLLPDCVRALSASQPIKIRSPRSTRPWQHVLDPLCGYLILAELLWKDPVRYGQGWNFGPADEDARPVSWIVSSIVKTWGDGASWEFVPSDARHEAKLLKVDASRAHSELGWFQRLRLKSALAWTVDWYREVLRGASARELTERQINQYSEIGIKEDEN